MNEYEIEAISYKLTKDYKVSRFGYETDKIESGSIEDVADETIDILFDLSGPGVAISKKLIGDNVLTFIDHPNQDFNTLIITKIKQAH